jgi:hypothetical protein
MAVGNLRIYLADPNGNNRTMLWELRGQQCTSRIDWRQGVVSILNINQDYKIVIEGTIHNQYVKLGDIA